MRNHTYKNKTLIFLILEMDALTDEDDKFRNILVNYIPGFVKFVSLF